MISGLEGEHLSAYLRVLRVCSQFDWAGLTHAIMQVLDLSPVWGGGRDGYRGGLKEAVWGARTGWI